VCRFDMLCSCLHTGACLCCAWVVHHTAHAHSLLPIPAQSPSLLTPHPCSLPVPAESATPCPAHTFSLPALSHPKMCHKHPLVANSHFANRKALTASLTHSISQSRCDAYRAICRGLQASSKQPGRHCNSCCTAYQPCTCPSQQTYNSISTRSRSLSRGAITGLGRCSQDASCCKLSFAPEVLSVAGKGDGR